MTPHSGAHGFKPDLLSQIIELLKEDQEWQAASFLLRGGSYDPSQLAENLATLCQTYAITKANEVLQFCAERAMIRADLKAEAFRTAFPPQS